MSLSPKSASTADFVAATLKLPSSTAFNHTQRSSKGLARERSSQNRMPQLAERFSYQGLTEKVSLFREVSFVCFFFSLLAEGSSWERWRPLEAEILGNKKKSYPTQIPAPPKQGSQLQRVQRVARPCVAATQGPIPGELAGAMFPLHGPGLHWGQLHPELPLLVQSGVTRKARENAVLLDCASKEAWKLGPRK